MWVVDKDQVSLINNKLVAEASTLGLAPGVWPDFISVVNKHQEGYLFMHPRRIEDGAMKYVTPNGDLELVVLND